MADDDNRELLTCIESVSASVVVLPPLIIYKGAAHYLGWHKFTESHTNTQDFQFSHYKRGWTNRILAMEWLTKIFEPQTTTNRRVRVLSLDGHDSHVTIEFIRFSMGHDIRLYCLLPHSTHLLQPLNIGLFGPLQHIYSRAVDDAIRNGVSSIFNSNFLPLYVGARQAAYTVDNIKSSWEGAGIIPLNSHVVVSRVEPQTISSTEEQPQDSGLPGQATPKDSKAVS